MAHVVSVEVAPDFSNFGSKMRAGLDRAVRSMGPGPNPFAGLDRDASRVGVTIGKSIADGIEAGVGRGIKALTQVGKAAEAQSASVAKAAATGANAMATSYQNGAVEVEATFGRLAEASNVSAIGVADGHAQAAGDIATSYANAAAQAGAALRKALEESGQGVTAGWGAGMGAAGERAGEAAGAGFSQAFEGRANSAFDQAKTMLNRLMGLGAAAGGAFLGTALVRGFQRLTTIEDATTAMGVILDSAKAADDMMKNVLAVVQGTPFSLDQFADAAKTLVAFNVEAQKIPGILTAIGEAGAASGKGAEGVGQLVNVFGQMSAMGKVSLDQVWSISMAGVKALDILGNAWNMTTAQMTEFISSGAVPAKQAIDVLTKGIMEGSDGINGHVNALGGTMAGLGKTVSGSLANFKTAIARFGAGLMSPVMKALPPLLNAASAALDKVTLRVKELSTTMVNSPGIQRGIEAITAAIKGIQQSDVDKILARMSQVLPFIAAGFSGLIRQVAGFLPVIGDIVGGISPLSFAFVAFLAAIPGVRKGFADFVSSVTPAVTLLVDRLSPVLKDITDIIGGIAPFVFKVAADAVSGLALALVGVLDVIKPITSWLSRHKEVVVAIATAYAAWATQAKIVAAYNAASAAKTIAGGGVLTAEQVAARQGLVAGGAGEAAIAGGVLGKMALGASRARDGMRGLVQSTKDFRGEWNSLRTGVKGYSDLGPQYMGMTRLAAGMEMAKGKAQGLASALANIPTSVGAAAGLAAFAGSAYYFSERANRADRKAIDQANRFTAALPGQNRGNMRRFNDPDLAYANAAKEFERANRYQQAANSKWDLIKQVDNAPLPAAINLLYRGAGGADGAIGLQKQAETSSAAGEKFLTKARNINKNLKAIRDETGLVNSQILRLAASSGTDLTQGFDASTDARKGLIKDINKLREDAQTAGISMNRAVKLDPEVVKQNQKVVEQVGQQVSQAWTSFFDITQVSSLPVDAGGSAYEDSYDYESAAERIRDAMDRVTEAQERLNDAKRKEPESVSDRHRLRDLKDAEAKANFEAHGVFKTREAAQQAQDAWKKAKQDLSDYYEEKAESDAKGAVDQAKKIKDAQKALDDAREALRSEQAKQDRDAEKRAEKANKAGGSDKNENLLSKILREQGADQAGLLIQEQYDKKLGQAREFAQNIQTAIAQGYDPDLIGRLLAQGPEQAGDFLKVLVGQTTTALRDIVNEGEKLSSEYAAFAVNLAQKNQIAINAVSNGTPADVVQRMQGEVTKAAQLDRIIQQSGGKGKLADIAYLAGLTPQEAQTVARDFGLNLGGYARQSDVVNRETARGVIKTTTDQGDGQLSLQRAFQAWIGGHPSAAKALGGARNDNERAMVSKSLWTQFLDDNQNAKKFYNSVAAGLSGVIDGFVADWGSEVANLNADAILTITSPDLDKIKVEMDNIRQGVEATARFMAKVEWDKGAETQVGYMILQRLGLTVDLSGNNVTVPPLRGDRPGAGPSGERRRDPYGNFAEQGYEYRPGDGAVLPTGNAAGGLYEGPHIQRGERIRYAEPETGGEAYLPRLGHRDRAEGIMQTVAGWYGGHYIPSKETGKQVRSFSEGGIYTDQQFVDAWKWISAINPQAAIGMGGHRAEDGSIVNPWFYMEPRAARLKQQEWMQAIARFFAGPSADNMGSNPTMARRFGYRPGTGFHRGWGDRNGERHGPFFRPRTPWSQFGPGRRRGWADREEAEGGIISFAAGGIYNGVNSTTINNEDPVGRVYRDPDEPFWWPGVMDMWWENGIWYDGAGRKVGTGPSPLRGPIHWTPPPGLNITEEMRRWNGRWPTAGARGDYDKWQTGGVSFGSSTGAGPGTFGDAYQKSIRPEANWRYRPRKGGGGDWVNLDTGKIEGWSDGKNGRVYRTGMRHPGLRTEWTMAMNRLQVQLDEQATTKDWTGDSKGIARGGSLSQATWDANARAFFTGGEGPQNSWTRAMHRLAVQQDKDWAAAQRPQPARPGGRRPRRPEEGSPGSGVDDTSPQGRPVPSWFAGSGSGPGTWNGNTVARPVPPRGSSPSGGRAVVSDMLSDTTIASARAGTALADVAGAEAMTRTRGGGDVYDESIHMNGDIIMNHVGNDVGPRGGAALLRHAKHTKAITSVPPQYRRRTS